MLPRKYGQRYLKEEKEFPSLSKFTSLAHIAAAQKVAGIERNVGYHYLPKGGGYTHPGSPLFETGHIKKHVKGKILSNKMEGMVSINTSPLENKYCLSMHARGKEMFEKHHPNPLICGKCYAMNSAQRRSVEKRYSENTRLLTQQILPFDQLPRFAPGEVIRIHALGELMNITHLQNILNIIKVNPHAYFVMWTKRVDLVKAIREKPRNLRLIYSNPIVDKIMMKPPHPLFEGVFNVVDTCDVTPNCAGQCRVCKRCYGERSPGTIIEKIRKLN